MASHWALKPVQTTADKPLADTNRVNGAYKDRKGTRAINALRAHSLSVYSCMVLAGLAMRETLLDGSITATAPLLGFVVEKFLDIARSIDEVRHLRTHIFNHRECDRCVPRDFQRHIH